MSSAVVVLLAILGLAYLISIGFIFVCMGYIILFLFTRDLQNSIDIEDISMAFYWIKKSIFAGIFLMMCIKLIDPLMIVFKTHTIHMSFIYWLMAPVIIPLAIFIIAGITAGMIDIIKRAMRTLKKIKV